MPSELPPGLIAAYEATEFRVFGAHPFTLRIGTFSPELDAAFRRWGVSSAAFITAWNPRGEAYAADANAALQASLVEAIAAMGLQSLSGIGVDPTGDWPGEESLLVLGLDQVAASSLGAAFEQNAIVWVGQDANPQLILLR
jgi:hypothetical protein